MRHEIEMDRVTVKGVAMEIAGMAALFAAVAAAVWLWCAGTPAQSSAEADFERAAHEEF